MNVISYDEVMKGLRAGLTEAEKREAVVGISIVDEAGHLIGAVHMPGSGYPWLCDDARGKAMVTVAWKGVPSAELQERAGSPMLVWMNNYYGGRLSYLKGGVPITRDGQLIGAAGAGGGPLADDEAIATAVAKAIGD